MQFCATGKDLESIMPNEISLRDREIKNILSHMSDIKKHIKVE